MIPVDLFLREQRPLSPRGTVIVCDTQAWNSHRQSLCLLHDANQSPRSCILWDRVHVYYMIELFNLFRSVSLLVRNFTEILKPRNFNIIIIWSHKSQLHTIEALINLRSMVLWFKLTDQSYLRIMLKVFIVFNLTVRAILLKFQIS